MVVKTGEKDERPKQETSGSRFKYLYIGAIIAGAGTAAAFFAVFVIIPHIARAIENQGPDAPPYLTVFHDLRYEYVAVVAGLGIAGLAASFALRAEAAVKKIVSALIIAYLVLFGILVASIGISLLRMSDVMRNLPPEVGLLS